MRSVLALRLTVSVCLPPARVTAIKLGQSLVVAQQDVALRAPSARQPGKHRLRPALPAPSSQSLLLCLMLLGHWQRPPLQPQLHELLCLFPLWVLLVKRTLLCPWPSPLPMSLCAVVVRLLVARAAWAVAAVSVMERTVVVMGGAASALGGVAAPLLQPL